MNIVGLGKGGCSIADLFSQYPEYKVFKIDTGIKGKDCFNIPLQKSMESYEENTPDFSKLNKINGEILFILCGGGNISGSSLRILEKFKEKEVTLLYIRPDPLLVPAEVAKKDRVTFKILQEYARSGLLKKMILISNSQVEESLGGLSILEYYDSLNKAIVSTIHMINYLLTAKEVFGKMTPQREMDRICTVGVYDTEDGYENYLYNLETPRQKVFFYAIKNSDLTENKNLIKLIQQQVRAAYTGSEVDISYKITTTNYEANFVYIISYTNIIQE
jgi:hypothetical protein